jgi:hypothetical protein
MIVITRCTRICNLPACLEEASFKINNRENPHMFRDAILGLIASDNLRFQIAEGMRSEDAIA